MNVPQANAPAETVQAAVIDWLRRELEDDSVAASDNFLEVGGHSLMATELNNWLSGEFGVQIDIRQLFELSLGEAIPG